MQIIIVHKRAATKANPFPIKTAFTVANCWSQLSIPGSIISICFLVQSISRIKTGWLGETKVTGLINSPRDFVSHSGSSANSINRFVVLPAITKGRSRIIDHNWVDTINYRKSKSGNRMFRKMCFVCIVKCRCRTAIKIHYEKNLAVRQSAKYLFLNREKMSAPRVHGGWTQITFTRRKAASALVNRIDWWFGAAGHRAINLKISWLTRLNAFRSKPQLVGWFIGASV